MIRFALHRLAMLCMLSGFLLPLVQAQSIYLDNPGDETIFSGFDDNAANGWGSTAGVYKIAKLDFDVAAFEETLASGTVKLPLYYKDGASYSWNAFAWRTFTLLDQASGQIYDDNTDAFRPYTMYSLRESDGDLASAVIFEDGEFLIGQQHEYRKANRSQIVHGLLIYADPSGSEGAAFIGRSEDYSPPVLTSSPPPLSAGNLACGVAQDDEDAADGPAALNSPTPTVVERNGVRALNLGWAYTEGIQGLLPPSMSSAAHAVMLTGMVNGIYRQELGLVFRPQYWMAVTDADFADADADPDGLYDALDELMPAFESGIPGLPEIDLGHTLIHGGGGLANPSGCINNNRYKAYSRIRGPLELDRWRTIAHEIGHQLGADHTFNANNNFRVGSSAYEPGSGYSLMSYVHFCPEEVSVPGGGTAEANHSVQTLAIDRIKNYGPWEDFFANVRLKFHTHSVEQINDHLQTHCPVRQVAPAIGPNVNINLVNGTTSSSQSGGKPVPLGKPVMLSAQAEPNTTYRWHQMDLGPADASPDLTATQNDDVGPKIGINGPTEDGISFIPARDYLLGPNTPTHHFSTLCENPGTNYNFRVQANRFVPMGADGANGQAALSVSEPVKLNCVTEGTEFGFTNGLWDFDEQQFATTEIGDPSGEALYQTVVEWNVAGTTGPPHNGDYVDIYLMQANDPSNMELLLENVPNEGQVVVELPPSATSEDGWALPQVLAIKLKNQVWFDISPAFYVLYAGCTNPIYDTYDPQANVHDQSACLFDFPTPPQFAEACKDPNACNYAEFAAVHVPSTCMYPTCSDASALNWSLATWPGVNAPLSCTGAECVYEEHACIEDAWAAPEDPALGWGFTGPFAPNRWFLNELGGGGIWDLAFTQHNSRLHLTLHAPEDATGMKSVRLQNGTFPPCTVTFDWQVVEPEGWSASGASIWSSPAGSTLLWTAGYSNNGLGDNPAASGTTTLQLEDGVFAFNLSTSSGADSPLGLIISNFRYDMNIVEGCTDEAATNFNFLATCDPDDVCVYPWDISQNAACYNPAACNFSGMLPGVHHDPDACTFRGCDDPAATNFDPTAGCPGPCCYSGDCDFASGGILWQDYNETWIEFDPLPDFDEVMFLPGGMVLFSPQTTDITAQTVSYTHNGSDADKISFMYAWVPGTLELPADMLSPARVQIWDGTTLLNTFTLDENTGVPLSGTLMDFPMQDFAYGLADWPGDPFDIDPTLGPGLLALTYETLPAFESVFRGIEININPGQEMRILMYSDSQEMVVDEDPCRLFITGMKMPQQCGAATGAASEVLGCMDPIACNYNPAANLDDGSCEAAGCMDEAAVNFNPEAICQTACFYLSDCGNLLTADTSFAYGFNGAFAPGLASANNIPEGLLIAENNLMVIAGPDQQFGSPNGASDHAISWTAQEDMTVQFAYAAASFDAGYQYDQAFYQVNGGEQFALTEVIGDDVNGDTWVIESDEWNPGPDYVLPSLSDVPYEGFVENLHVPLRVLKTAILLNAGDVLTIGVHSDDGIFGEVVLAVMGMVWSNHCVEVPVESLDGCLDPDACNYNPDVTNHVDELCIYPGMACNDGDACTYNDAYSAACICKGDFADADGDDVCDLDDVCPNNPQFTFEPGPCGCEPTTDENGNGFFDCLETCEVDADGDGICAENDCDDNDPNMPDPVTGECIQTCGCLDPMALNYNAEAMCAGVCVYADDCGAAGFGLTAANLPAGFGFTGAYGEVAPSGMVWEYYDGFDTGFGFMPPLTAGVVGDADQILYLGGPVGNLRRTSVGFTMPISGTFAFSWNYLHGDDVLRPLAWVEVGTRTRVFDLRIPGLQPDANTVLPTDWYGPLASGSFRVLDLPQATLDAPGGYDILDESEWCGVTFNNTIPGANADMVSENGSHYYDYWYPSVKNGAFTPWATDEPLGDYAALLFPSLDAVTAFGGPDVLNELGWQPPVLIRAEAGEYIRFNVGFNQGYDSGSTGVLVLSAPMWLNNCGAEPCYTATENLCPADIDGDGFVGVGDLLLVLADFGDSCPE